MKKITLLLLAILTSQFAFLQKNGTISGKIVDETNGETLIGVSVKIKDGNQGTITDLDGNYILSVKPGIYDVEVSYVSYQTKVAEKVLVKSGETFELSMSLKEAVSELGTYTFQSQAERGTNTALILDQKNSAVMFDGIGSDQMRKTPDRNTADVLRRVSGATIQDNFVIIRGLPDRYNAAYLNGSPLPSSEPDRKAFSFDIFPAALLSDLRIIKTAMPSLSGEFAGGLIQIRTKDIPEKTFYNFSLGVTADLITTFGSFRSAQGGSTDFFGIDDGTRSLPNIFPTNAQLTSDQNNFLKDSLVKYALMLKNNFAVQNRIAAPGLNFQFSMGHNINLVPKAKQGKVDYKSEFGSVFALTFNNRVTYRQIERNDYDGVDKNLTLNDDQYNTNTSWGGVWNLAYQHSNKNGANNRISFKNLFNINTNDQLVSRTGQDLINGFDLKSYSMLYTESSMFSTQLNGEHVLPKSKIKFEWGAGYSRMNRIVPDYKNVGYRKTLGDSTSAYAVPFSNNVQLDVAGRFFSTQLDNSYNGVFDFTLPFKIGPSKHDLKVGAFLSYKDREFQGRQLGYVKYKSAAADVPAISMMGIDTIFMDRNFGPEGLMVKEGTTKSDGYGASQALVAGYVQLEHSFFENKFKIVWGARVESFRQKLSSFTYATQLPVNLDTNVVDVLPSANFIYSINEKMNLRLSGSQTVARAESRELAPFTFYDYNLFAYVAGNPNLVRTKITNADLRYEWYPMANQLVSATVFFKHFQNPIEKVLIPVGSSRLFTYQNVPTAYCFGLELEYRFSIGSFIKKKHSRFLDDLSFTGNFSYIQSEVNLDSVAGVNERRPLQGQSPYIVNAGLLYNDSKFDFGVNLVVNYVGPRIFTVGNVNYGAIWENPRFIMDLQLTKTFLKKKLELRMNFSDLFAQTAIYFQDSNGNRTYEEGIDNKMIGRRMGQQISFTVGYKF